MTLYEKSIIYKMSEELKIPEEESIGNKQLTSDTSPQPAIDAESGTSVPIAIGNQPQTENMEVHKHPHHVTHKKKWGEYLLEFFMLFLAVFLGFVAENIREHIVEKERSKQYITSLFEDLKVDTGRMGSIINYDDEKISALNNLEACYDAVMKNWKETSCMAVLVKYSKTNRAFTINDRTLTQLATAGGFRLLQKQDADRIIDYQNSFKSYLDFQTTIFQGAQDNVRNTLNLLANFKVNLPLQSFSSALGADTTNTHLKGSLLFTPDRVLLNKWFNELALYLRVTKGQRKVLTDLRDKATGLIEFLKHNHHLESE